MQFYFGNIRRARFPFEDASEESNQKKLSTMHVHWDQAPTSRNFQRFTPHTGITTITAVKESGTTKAFHTDAFDALWWQ